jgi:hypothetical protein
MRILSLAAGLALLAIGCGGDKRAEVSGKVTMAGKSLPGGIITFVSASDSNRVGTGVISADGNYRVGDAPVGECKVVVDNSHLDPAINKKTSSMPGMGPSGMPGMKGGPPGAGPKGPPADAKGKMSAPPSKDPAPTADMGKAESADSKFAKLDPVYSKHDSTPLTATVVGGANTINFEVK